MSRFQWIVVLTALSWALLLSPFLVARAFAAGCPLAHTPYYAPPVCGSAPVCQFSGPGGCVRDWMLSAELAVLLGKTLNVPAKVCASACVIAVGKAIELGGKVTISPRAQLIWPHGHKSFAALKLPVWLQRKVTVYG